jgi:hypothetical protein
MQVLPLTMRLRGFGTKGLCDWRNSISKKNILFRNNILIVNLRLPVHAGNFSN